MGSEASKGSVYKIGKPRKHGRWLVFPNTAFDQLDLSDCNDAIDGVCLSGKSLDECISHCAQDPSLCAAGYFISHPKGNICVPIRTNIHDRLNPAYRLRNANMYPELREKSVATYIDAEKFPFPPKNVNAVFFQDPFVLENVATGSRLRLLNRASDGNLVEFGEPQEDGDKGGERTVLLPQRDTMYTNQVYIPVEYGEPVVLNVPGTSLLMRPVEHDYMGWVSRMAVDSGDQNVIRFHRANGDPEGSNLLNYDDTVYMTYQNVFVVVFDEDKQSLRLEYSSYADALTKGLNVHFRLSPRIQVYHCEDGECKSLSLAKTKMRGAEASHNGNPVSRNPTCWGFCPKKTFAAKHLYWVFLAAVLMLIVTVWLVYRNSE